MMRKYDLNSLLRPDQPLPPGSVMVAKALEILELSPHGQQLTNFAEKKNVAIAVIATPQPVAYLPEKGHVYVGFNHAHPVPPSQFVLMLAGALREAQQEAAGIKLPQVHAPLEEHVKVGMAKHEDKVWYMCTVAYELDEQASLSEYHFLDELGKMGHTESIELFIKQKRQDG